jgi:hypothetical protein
VVEGPGKSPRFSPGQCGGAEHRNPAAPALGATAVSCQALHDRQRECSGLAGARLGDAESIASGKNDRDGFGLDWGRRFATFGLQRLKNRCAEAQVQKICQCCLLSGGHAWSAAPKSRSAAQRKGPVAWRHPACPGLSDWCLGRSTGGRFRESARSSFTRLERRKSLNRAVTPYFMLRRTSQTQRKPEGHDHKIRCPNGRWPRRRGARTLPPSISALYFGPLFRHDEDLNSAAEGAERTAD